MSSPNVVFVVGPTASGKSALAINACVDFGGQLFNCDSVQTYMGLNIGAAAPTQLDKSRCPHFLFAYVEKNKESTAGEHRRNFFDCISENNTGEPVFLVGGTGFYFQAIERGMFNLPKIPQQVRDNLSIEIKQKNGPEILHAELSLKDPETAIKINIADHYRILRALEIIRYTGLSVSSFRKEFLKDEKKFPFPLKKIGIRWDRGELHKRIEKRTEFMLEQGLVEEVENLLKEGLENWLPMRSVGYREVVTFLQSGGSLENLKAEIVLSTNQLAKKQMTWFQRDKEILWIDAKDSHREFKNQLKPFIRS